MPRPKRVGVRALRRCVRAWKQRLLLHDWTITVAVGECGGDLAECHARPEYREAEVTFNLARLPPEQLDETVRHELLHCWTWGLWSAGEAQARSDAARELLRREHEGLTTKLSQVVALARQWP